VSSSPSVDNLLEEKWERDAEIGADWAGYMGRWKTGAPALEEEPAASFATTRPLAGYARPRRIDSTVDGAQLLRLCFGWSGRRRPASLKDSSHTVWAGPGAGSLDRGRGLLGRHGSTPYRDRRLGKAPEPGNGRLQGAIGVSSRAMPGVTGKPFRTFVTLAAIAGSSAMMPAGAFPAVFRMPPMNLLRHLEPRPCPRESVVRGRPRRSTTRSTEMRLRARGLQPTRGPLRRGNKRDQYRRIIPARP